MAGERFVRSRHRCPPRSPVVFAAERDFCQASATTTLQQQPTTRRHTSLVNSCPRLHATADMPSAQWATKAPYTLRHWCTRCILARYQRDIRLWLLPSPPDSGRRAAGWESGVDNGGSVEVCIPRTCMSTHSIRQTADIFAILQRAHCKREPCVH